MNNNLPHFGLNGASQQGLNGLFGRFLKGLITKIAAMVDGYVSAYSGGFANTDFTEYAESIGSGGSEFWNRTDGTTDSGFIADDTDPRGMYEPTIEEAGILEGFAKVFGSVIADIVLKTNSLPTTVDNQSKVDISNAILRRISVIQWYYKNYELAGLSADAVALRSYSIELLAKPILKTLEIEMNGFATFEASLGTKMLSKQWYDDLAPVKNFQVTTPNNPDVYFTGYQLGTRQTVIVDPIKEPVLYPVIEPSNPIQTVSPSETQPTATNVATCKTSNNWWKWALGGFAFGMVINK